MSLIDLLRMSSANLKRRRLRTFLTVLGVIIGTASIVVMISLGLGLQNAMYAEVEKYGGLTSIQVTDTRYGSDYGNSDSIKYLTDDTVTALGAIPHVELASPTLEMDVLILKGQYIGWVTLTGMTPEGFAKANIDLAEGSSLPEKNSSSLEILMGNGVIQNMYNKNGGSDYWDTGEYPDIDMRNDTLFYVLDTDAYYNSSDEASGTPVKKYTFPTCGLVAGEPEDYNNYTYGAYCDLSSLKTLLEKEFRGKVIPNQPTTSSGKAYKEIVYSSIQVYVDDLDNVNEVQNAIRSLGYNASSNAEYLESTKSEFAIIQAVLGGIGAVSLFVAAIGIANTMMMSIYERTKEIGIIKVLGCSLQNIRQMFLLEAAFIGLLGGFIGNILSALISFGINNVVSASDILGVDGNISYIPFWLMLLSMGFAMLVGVAAGYFPARRAMRLSPLEAIRNN